MQKKNYTQVLNISNVQTKLSINAMHNLRKNYTHYFKIQKRCLVSNVQKELFTNYIHSWMVSNAQTELFTNDIYSFTKQL